MPEIATDRAEPQSGSDSPPWLSDFRVTVPDRVIGYLERPALLERCMSTERPLTVLKAPCG